MSTDEYLSLRLRQALPRIPPLFQDETYLSYEKRLADANHVSWLELRRHLTGRIPHRLDLDRLALATGQAHRTLLLALPELRIHPNQCHNIPLAGRTVVSVHTQRRPVCRRCSAGKSITGTVTRWTRHDQNVCLSHLLWTGPRIIRPGQQVDLISLPEVVDAQRHHHNLIRRYGQRIVGHAFHDASQITMRWVGSGRWNNSRLRIVHNVCGHLQNSISRDHRLTPLVIYPQTIALTSMFANPYWHTVAGLVARGSEQRHEHRFCQEVEHRTGITGIDLGGPGDPLRRWCRPERGTQHDMNWWIAASLRIEIEEDRESFRLPQF